jgi:hypothetical protein
LRRAALIPLLAVAGLVLLAAPAGATLWLIGDYEAVSAYKAVIDSCSTCCRSFESLVALLQNARSETRVEVRRDPQWCGVGPDLSLQLDRLWCLAVDQFNESGSVLVDLDDLDALVAAEASGGGPAWQTTGCAYVAHALAEAHYAGLYEAPVYEQCHRYALKWENWIRKSLRQPGRVLHRLTPDASAEAPLRGKQFASYAIAPGDSAVEVIYYSDVGRIDSVGHFPASHLHTLTRDKVFIQRLLSGE